MLHPLEIHLRSILHFDHITSVETIQSLWSGYGSLDRVYLEGSERASVIVKNIQASSDVKHPRGWNHDVGHQRKLRSYEVEAHWYQHYNHFTNQHCRMARLLGYRQTEARTLLVLEDLNLAGFALRRSSLADKELHACLDWLAAFHAKFMHPSAKGLWPTGTYWHLETRQAEWEAMPDGKLKQNAAAIDEKMSQARFQTIVHGDAKFANFCFAKDGRVAAVDFQYVGKGCGMKDVAYLLSCIEGGVQDQGQEDALLGFYFSQLKHHLKHEKTSIDFNDLEKEWRELYAFAWADFERFLQGWAPGHWKSTAYAQRQVEQALSML